MMEHYSLYENNISPERVSLNYYAFISDFTQSCFENEKALGQFYTDLEVAENMMAVICDRFNFKEKTVIRIIDPFCGDGRLIKTLLASMAEKVQANEVEIDITIWDIDENAVLSAKTSIEKYSKDVGIATKISAATGDAFIEYRKHYGEYDICVTNPPWILLKPQKLFNKNNDGERLEEYKKAIEQYDLYIKNEFQLSQPSSKFGKWGTNLARCGVEVALKLIKTSGICGVVSPASLLNDQVSDNLRCWMFTNFKIEAVSYYPAELKLYGSADVSSITFVAIPGENTRSIAIKTYSNRSKYKENLISEKEIEFIKKNRFVIPLKIGIESITMMKHLETLPTALDYCNSIGVFFTRELDETRITEKLCKEGHIRFAKGYMVDRFSFSVEDQFLNESLVSPPESVRQYKVVWRDVSRDSQLRRMKATLLPPGYICGNSLGVICGSEDRLPYLKMLLAVINSTSFEYQARAKLVSNHVSAGIVKQLRIPNFTLDKRILELIDRALDGEKVERELDLLVARLYNLSNTEYKTILDAFKFNESEKDSLVHDYMSITPKGDKK